MGTKRLFTVMQSLTKIMVMCCLVNFTTGTNVAYVIGKLQDCVTVKNESTCRIDYYVPDYFAQQYDHSLKIIQRILPKSSSDGCEETLRKLLCGQSFPRCVSPKAKQIDFGNATSLCARLQRDCSKRRHSVIRKFAKFNLCKLAQSGLFDLDRCIYSNTTKYSNSCAKLSNKTVPTWIADRYGKRAKKNISCNTQCKIPFCSSNKKYILTTYTKQKCMTELKCLFGDLMAGNGIGMMCNSYPDENKTNHKKIYVV